MNKENLELSVYTNEELGVTIRTIVDENNNPWFVGKDVAEVLGYSNTKDALARHVDAEDKTGSQITTSGQRREMTIINESGLYSLILSSKLPKAKEFKHWVTSEVLPSIRKTGTYSMNQPKTENAISDDVKLKMEFASWASGFLNLNDNSKLLLAQSIATEIGMDKALPQYTVSKGVLKPIGELLKVYNINMSANAFNKVLEAHGYIETLERKSSKGIKKYRHITKKGLAFGENQVSPHNPKETQPLWFVDRFNEMYRSLS